MTLLLLVHHEKKDHHDHNPVTIVRDDGTISGRVLPTKNGIENHITVLGFRVATVDVPDTLSNLIRARTITFFRNVTTSPSVKLVRLEVPNSTREQGCTNKIDEAGRSNEENLIDIMLPPR